MNSNQSSFRRHLAKIIGLKAVLHQFPNMALAALLVCSAGAFGFGCPNPHKVTDGGMKPVVVDHLLNADVVFGRVALGQFTPGDDFGGVKFQRGNCVEEFLVSAKDSPIFKTETGSKLLLGGGETFDADHNSKLSFRSPATCRSGESVNPNHGINLADWLRQSILKQPQFYHA